MFRGAFVVAEKYCVSLTKLLIPFRDNILYLAMIVGAGVSHETIEIAAALRMHNNTT